MSDVSFQPVSGNVSPRFAGIPTFMRLPHIQVTEAAEKGVDIGLIGVPWDGGTPTRTGARHGPRQMRDQSSLMRNEHPVSGIRPYESANCADLGDTPVNPISVETTLAKVEAFYDQAVQAGVVPLSAGGDHLVTLPILRALAKKHGPVGLVHFDSHNDLSDTYFDGIKAFNGTPFRRGIEEGILDPKRMVSIGIRGNLYDRGDEEWGLTQGVRVIRIEEYFNLGVPEVMAQARRVAGDGPTYITFDIDAIDPAYAPGTGTPEIGGFTSFDAQQMVRALRGLNLVGADVVEISPPLDPTGNTALVGTTLMWEILCLLADKIDQDKRKR